MAVVRICLIATLVLLSLMIHLRCSHSLKPPASAFRQILCSSSHLSYLASMLYAPQSASPHRRIFFIFDFVLTLAFSSVFNLRLASIPPLLLLDNTSPPYQTHHSTRTTCRLQQEIPLVSTASRALCEHQHRARGCCAIVPGRHSGHSASRG
jgi:hypothetical protein